MKVATFCNNVQELVYPPKPDNDARHLLITLIERESHGAIVAGIVHVSIDAADEVDGKPYSTDALRKTAHWLTALADAEDAERAGPPRVA